MKNSMNPHPNQSAKRRGFTMVELLVTVGILVIVTAGVATIFNSIGTTVARGRKLSELNQFAARLERVMREDFDEMTRDGFMVIVHKNANNGEDVKLFRGEKTDIDNGLYGAFSDGPGRIRRSDEIMFFRRGDFETARRAISPDMIATSHEAAIWYGHGQKRRPQLTGFNGVNNFFFNPATWDSNYDYVNNENQAGAGFTATAPGGLNPNEFARDWSLLRQVTLLSTPLGNSRDVPTELFGYSRSISAQRERLLDSDRQIALQPAARSIFNSLGWTDPSRVSPPPAPPAGPSKIRWLGDEASFLLSNRQLPSYRASGLVDVATEDLATIRSMIQSLPVKVSPLDYAGFNSSGSFGTNRGADNVSQNRDVFEFDFWQTASDLPDSGNIIPDPRDSDELNMSNATHRSNIRMWMIDALPSRWDLSVTPPRHLAGVRYEDIPTRIMFPKSQFADSDLGDLQRAYAESHQEMLGASVFVPRCSEFIVEWSYGFVDNRRVAGDVGFEYDFKELIWYGLDRTIDSNNDGLLDGADRIAATPYRRRGIAVAGNDPITNAARERGLESQQVVGRPGMAPGARFNPNYVEIATFGFMDPKGNPLTGPMGEPNLDDGDEWLWPKFVRITMKLADATDRAVEETYQIVFKIPELEQ